MMKKEWVCTAIVNEKTGISYGHMEMYGYIPDGTRFYMENINTGETYICKKILMSYLNIIGYYHKSKTLYKINSDELKLLKLLRYKRIYGCFNIELPSYLQFELSVKANAKEIKEGFAFVQKRPIYTMWDYILNIALKDKRFYRLTDNTLSIAITNGVSFKWVEYSIKNKASIVKLIMMR